jgi:hypothetical protein
MPDLLDRSRRIRTRRGLPSEEAYVAESAPKNNAKALYIDARRSASLRNLTTNLGRAVVQNVRVLESRAEDENADKFSMVIGAVIGRGLPHGDDNYVRRGGVQIANDRSAVEDFLDRARRLDALGRTDSALDVVYNYIDEMLLAGKFSEVDDRLSSTECDEYSVDLLLALLTITFAAKRHLPHRQRFYAQVEQSIRAKGEWEEGLLYGLE